MEPASELDAYSTRKPLNVCVTAVPMFNPFFLLALSPTPPPPSEAFGFWFNRITNMYPLDARDFFVSFYVLLRDTEE
jgi:hypothetical protein